MGAPQSKDLLGTRKRRIEYPAGDVHGGLIMFYIDVVHKEGNV